MTIARELVTLLRYEIDDSSLRKFNRGPRAPGNVPGMPTPAVIDNTSNAMGRLGLMIRSLAAGISVLAATRIADEWAGVEGRVGLVTNGIEEQKQALDGLYELAQRTRQGYAGVGQVFQGIARNGKELGLQLEDQLKLTEAIGTAMTIGGGTAASQEAALVQLSQALGTGVLRGEELNSVMEQAPRLAQAIAKAFNVPIGKLKELGEQGKLSSKILAEGLLKQSAELRAEFERIPLTFSGSWTMITNAIGRQIDIFNRSTGAANKFYKASKLVIDNLETIIKTVALLGTAALLTKLAFAMDRLRASGGALSGILARFGGARAFGVLLGTFARMLAIATALYYVFDDIGVWLAGGDSLLGDIIGQTSDWKWLTDSVSSALIVIKDALGGGAQTLADWVSKWGLIGVIVFGLIAAIGVIPSTIAAIVVAWANVFNYVRTNWDSLVADTLYNIERIASALRNMIPESVRNFFSKLGGAFTSGPAGGAPSAAGVTGPGGAAFGITPGGMARAPAGGGTTVVTQAPSITINAANANPATVADAASRGVTRGLGAAAVPMVEAR
jgi:tape measure domain-containing protein